jgi:hypothetical protein
MSDLSVQRSLAEVMKVVAQERAIGCVLGADADTAAAALDAVFTGRSGAGGVVRAAAVGTRRPVGAGGCPV